MYLGPGLILFSIVTELVLANVLVVPSKPQKMINDAEIAINVNFSVFIPNSPSDNFSY